MDDDDDDDDDDKDNDCGTTRGMNDMQKTRSTRIKPAPVPLCLLQNSHELIRARTRAAAVGSR
jgi:hypothetical protein